MKTEEFDDALRQKIESINPLYEEGDIDKVHNYVTQRRSIYSNKSLKYIIGASSAGLVIAGLLLWNISQWNEHKDLMQKVEILQKNLSQSEAKAPVTKTDTVIIKEYVHDAPLNNQAPQQKVALSNQNNLSYGAENNNANKTPDDLINQHNKTTSKDLTANNNKEDISNQENISSNNVINESSEMASNKDIHANIESKNQQDITQVKQDDPIIAKDDSKDLTPQETIFDSTNKVAKPHHSFFAFLKNWKYQAGLGIEKANRQIGYNAYSEVAFNDKFSFSAGIKWLNINNESYGNDNDFHNRKGRNFQSTYNQNVSETATNISDIDVHDKIIQIPLAVTYHVYLKHFFSLLFSGGTDMEVYTKQIIGYKHSDALNLNVLSNFETNYQSLIFNNAVLSVGIEKRWKSLIFQAKPFISPQLQTVTYKKENLYYGLHINAAYSFGG